MKKLLIYTVFSFVLPVLGILFFYLDFKSFSNEIKANMHYIMTPSKEQNDVIFIGNSRTYVQIDPRKVDSVSGLRSYNLGLDGCNVPFFYMALSKYLQCHPAPGYVVINADFAGFNTTEKVYNYPDYQEYLGDSLVAACLMPYYAEFRHGLLARFSLFMEINSKPDEEKIASLMYHVKGIKSKDKGVQADLKRGFSPSTNMWGTQQHKIDSYKSPFTSQGLDLLRQTIGICKSKGIKVILVCPPLFKDYHSIIVNYDTIRDSLQSIANQYKVPYWIYADSYLGNTTDYFYNVEHLNATGAGIFSQMLGDDIRKYAADSTYVPDMVARKKK